MGLSNMAGIIEKENPNKEAYILDVPAGTGLLGEKVSTIRFQIGDDDDDDDDDDNDDDDDDDDDDAC